MADKSFGVKELNLLNASGTPTVTSPNNLNLNANTVAISTSCTIGNNLTVTSTTNSANLNVTGIGTLTRAFATDLSVSGVTTITVPANANPHSSWDVVNNSASAYRFTGPGQDGAEDNPNIYLVRGQRYVFKMNASGHPFQIQSGGSAYSDGVTNNGAETGNVEINVQHDAPPQLAYQCTSHSDMGGNIFIGSAEGGVGAGASIHCPASNTLTFGTNNSERFRIASSGQFGIGGSNYGSAGQVITSGGPSSPATWSDVNNVLDMWQISADVTDSDSTVRYFGIGDWTQKTGNPYANLGYIGAYELNGIFRMPSTGYYEIEMIIGWNIYNSTCKGCTNAIYTTTDNSTYTAAMTSEVHAGGGQAGTNQSVNHIKLFWKVNNISNDKFKISYSSFNADPYIESNTSFLYIKKLRDL